jgi:hypothetical protein
MVDVRERLLSELDDAGDETGGDGSDSYGDWHREDVQTHVAPARCAAHFLVRTSTTRSDV